MLIRSSFLPVTLSFRTSLTESVAVESMFNCTKSRSRIHTKPEFLSCTPIFKSENLSLDQFRYLSFPSSYSLYMFEILTPFRPRTKQSRSRESLAVQACTADSVQAGAPLGERGGAL